MIVKKSITFICCLVMIKGETISKNITSTYDPGELLARIFSGDTNHLRANNGFIKFDDLHSDFVAFGSQDSKPSTSEGVVKFNNRLEHINSLDTNDDSQSGKVKFEDNKVIPNEDHVLGNAFGLNANKVNGGGQKKRRRRKPKQLPVQPGYPYPVYPGPIPPGPQSSLVNPYFQPGFTGQFYRPPRRPRPSVASDALSAVTGALTSIALNDDYQCVARLLCEAAAGGALGGSSLLQSVSGLEPLLTLLSAYSGVSSNPLFVFGRAAFLGMSSKGNPGSCRYAYSLCPTDPEQLVHYLNNHNGGFFRFFNSPQPGQQNVEQFYNQLSQNYGFYQGNQQHYGFLNQGQLPNSYSNGPNNQGHNLFNQDQFPSDPNQGHYGFSQGQVPNYPQKPNLYPNDNGYQKYGLAFPYNQNYNALKGDRYRNGNINDGEDKIQKRIQNKPTSFANDNNDAQTTKWLFPGENDEDIGVNYANFNDFKHNDDRKGKTLRFPDTAAIYESNIQKEYNRKPKDTYSTYERDTYRHPESISFPERQSDRYNANNNYNTYYPSYNNRPYNSNIHKDTYNDNQDETGVQTVYVVRGNGDPNYPEIVKLRPGEKLT